MENLSLARTQNCARTDYLVKVEPDLIVGVLFEKHSHARSLFYLIVKEQLEDNETPPIDSHLSTSGKEGLYRVDLPCQAKNEGPECSFFSPL